MRGDFESIQHSGSGEPLRPLTTPVHETEGRTRYGVSRICAISPDEIPQYLETMQADFRRMEDELPSMLSQPEQWSSMRHEARPAINRLMTSWDQDRYRIFLNEIEALPSNADQTGQQPYYHWHEWPSIIGIKEGSYEMGVGVGEGNTPPPIALRFELPKGSIYEWAHQNTWHYVRPLKGQAVRSVMMIPKKTGWRRQSPPALIKAAETMEIQYLTDQKKLEMLDRYKRYYNPDVY